jgi:hypothetical protein
VPIADPNPVPHLVATAVGGVREGPGEAIGSALTTALRERQTLLVIDNCEHLLEACARLVDDLIRSCERLHVLATSREALGLTGEVAWRVPSLAIPSANKHQMLSYQVAKLAVTAWILRLPGELGWTESHRKPAGPRDGQGRLGEDFEGFAVLGFVMSRLVPFFAAADPERGARQYVRLAEDQALSNVSGKYFVSGCEKPDGWSRLSLDPEVQKGIEDAAEAWAAPFVPPHLTGVVAPSLERAIEHA